MTKLPNEELSWEEAVARYLTENRDYFRRRADLLEVLDIPHAGKGGAISLIERQVEVLRARLAVKDREWQNFVAVARDNDALGEKLHRLAVSLIDAASLDDVLGSLYDLGRHELGLDRVVISLGVEGGSLGGRAEFVPPDDPRLRQALALSGERSLCGPVGLLGDLRELLGADEAQMRSMALVPLRDPVRCGFVLFASRDEQRFPVGIGTTYLDRIGALFLRACARQLNGA
ncbi:MAG: DUF484 family protein [Gammaproteobacteria bacterium]|nr:DUF484 family protein [Gammaproteobacteria bacterium]